MVANRGRWLVPIRKKTVVAVVTFWSFPNLLIFLKISHSVLGLLEFSLLVSVEDESFSET